MMNAVPNEPPEPDNKRAAVTGGGGPPHDGDLERRVTVLETRFDTILPTLATKADLAELRLDLSEKINDSRRELNEKMDALRVELHVALTNIMKWCVGVAMTLFVGMVSQGLYLGAQINNLAARLPAAAVAPAPAQPAASPARTVPVPPAQPRPESAPEPG